MPTLFSYTIPIDDGAAPNPFYGYCTLAICKPRIRSSAQVGDWVAGLGSTNAPSGNLAGRLVYAMRVEEVLTLKSYDEKARAGSIQRIPDVKSSFLPDRLGDCIYDFSTGEPKQRPSVHGPGNQSTDVAGRNVLMSRDFYYFGKNAVELPQNLHPIIHQQQGHRSQSNNQFVERFIDWIRGSEFESGQVYGWPDFTVDWKRVGDCGVCEPRKIDGENDVPC
ncbi:MAG: hypothetical protein ACRBEQ_06780 [Hyphomonas sp.]